MSGEAAGHVCAFARSQGGVTLVTGVLKGFTRLVSDDGRTFDAARLGDTVVELPAEAARFRDWAYGAPVESVVEGRTPTVPAAHIFGALPAAIWLA